MSLNSFSSAPVLIVGYGNQGQAQALNLRDSGIEVIIGARNLESPGAHRARGEGFRVWALERAAAQFSLLLFLIPDHEIGPLYQALLPTMGSFPKRIGFAHGYAFHFQTFPLQSHHEYFLAAPRGPGALLRTRYLSGERLPGVTAVANASDDSLLQFAVDYCKAIGADNPLLQSTFAQETLCDLFGEQAVLCGGLMELMQAAHQTLVEKGCDPKLAFIECCYEVKTIAELFLKFGPHEMANRISPTAFYGGTTRGERVLGKGLPERLREIFTEIESGQFHREWQEQVESGMPLLKKARSQWRDSALEKTFGSFEEPLN